MSDRRLSEVERRIRAWARRPPRISPGAARARLVARLAEGDRPGAAWRLAIAGTAAGALLAVVLAVLPGPVRPPAGPSSSAPLDAGAPAPRMLVYELASGARLYLPLASAEAPSPEETER